MKKEEEWYYQQLEIEKQKNAEMKALTDSIIADLNYLKELINARPKSQTN